MKKILLSFAVVLSLFINGCAYYSQNENTDSITYQPTALGKSVNVYDEYGKHVGFLIKEYTDQCGSDCVVNVIFLKRTNSNYITEIIDSLSSDSLGFDFMEKDKNIYKSSFIWGEGEGHWGCHYFKLQKIAYVRGKFEIVDERRSSKKYAFDPNNQCGLFLGIDKTDFR